MRAKYCKCKNTYCISCCKDCNAADYWKQGIGVITGIPDSDDDDDQIKMK